MADLFNTLWSVDGFIILLLIISGHWAHKRGVAIDALREDMTERLDRIEAALGISDDDTDTPY